MPDGSGTTDAMPSIAVKSIRLPEPSANWVRSDADEPGLTNETSPMPSGAVEATA